MQVSQKVNPFYAKYTPIYTNQGTAFTICEFASLKKSANYRYRQKTLNSLKYAFNSAFGITIT